MTKALVQVGAIYVPGTAKYYSGLNPDPWFQAHEDFERDMRISPDAQSATEEKFVSRCRELIERYQREGTPSQGVSIADAINLETEQRVKEWQSRKAKCCIHCDSKSDLTLQAHPEIPTDVLIVCRNCLTDRSA